MFLSLPLIGNTLGVSNSGDRLYRSLALATGAIAHLSRRGTSSYRLNVFSFDHDAMIVAEAHGTTCMFLALIPSVVGAGERSDFWEEPERRCS